MYNTTVVALAGGWRILWHDHEVEALVWFQIWRNFDFRGQFFSSDLTRSGVRSQIWMSVENNDIPTYMPISDLVHGSIFISLTWLDLGLGDLRPSYSHLDICYSQTGKGKIWLKIWSDMPLNYWRHYFCFKIWLEFWLYAFLVRSGPDSHILSLTFCWPDIGWILALRSGLICFCLFVFFVRH